MAADTPVTHARSPDVHALLAMSTRHGKDSPIGNRCMNLVQKMKAHAECRDPARAVEIEKNMRREIAEIAELTGGMQ